MQIAVLANAESYYARDLERAIVERGHCYLRTDFPTLVSRLPGGKLRSEENPSDVSCGGLTARRDVDPLSSAKSSHGDCVDLTKVDAVLVRTMPPGSLEQVVYRMDALAGLEGQGVPVVNSAKALECAVDKFLTSRRLRQAGLPIPETYVCERADDALECFERLGGDVVVKPIFGSEGRGILRVSDGELAERVFKTLERLQAVLYVQQYVRHEGSDVRVMVLDGAVLGAMRRESNGDFRTNISRNGTACPHVALEQERTWALTAAKSVGARIAGIDILYDLEGNGYVIEVNAVPGWKAFRQVTGIDVAARLIERLEAGAAG